MSSTLLTNSCLFFIVGTGWFCSSSSQIQSSSSCQRCRCAYSVRSSPVVSAERASRSAHGVSRQQKPSHSAKSCRPNKHIIYDYIYIIRNVGFSPLYQYIIICDTDLAGRLSGVFSRYSGLLPIPQVP